MEINVGLRPPGGPQRSKNQEKKTPSTATPHTHTQKQQNQYTFKTSKDIEKQLSAELGSDWRVSGVVLGGFSEIFKKI